MSGLRILITNSRLADRSGTELYVRDLALQLLKRGHNPVVYTMQPGALAEEVRAATIPVIDDISRLTTPPDIIHAHHHLEAMSALLHFPGVPAIYVCHGWLPWQESPPRFPRILRYVAVDETCKDRLICEAGIPVERTRLILNFVDLSRFTPRAPLPPKPARALFFNNEATESTSIPIVRKACEREGISLDVIGFAAGRPCDDPAAALRQYDIVFGRARCAIEAMAVGAAAIVCDSTGVAGMVTTANFDRLLPLNFGIRSLREPLDAATLSREIDRYDAADAAKVSYRIRAVADIGRAVDEFEELYHEVIREFDGEPNGDCVGESKAAAAYLRSIAPRLYGYDAACRSLDELSSSRLLRIRATLLRIPLLGRILSRRK